MSPVRNQNTEQHARDKIDNLLETSGWVVQDKDHIDFNSGEGQAVKEYTTDVGPADYVLFVDRQPVSILEAKREDKSQNITTVEDQTLVDTRNLGEQAEHEFMAYTPSDDSRKFTELYSVQRLRSSAVPKDAQVCISTIQRMYSILQEKPLDESEE